jgi:hypothetical protein
LTFSGTPNNNDARLYVVKATPRQDPECGPQHPKDAVIIEIGSEGCSFDGLDARKYVNLKDLLGVGQVGPYVRIGTLRYSSYHNSLFLSIDTDYRNDTLPVKVYEIDLELTTILNTYTGANVHNDEPNMAVSPVDGKLYICEPNMGQPDNDVLPRNGEGDLIAIDTSSGSTGTYTTIVDGSTYSAGDSLWNRPLCPIYRGVYNPSGRPTLAVQFGRDVTSTPVLEFYLDANDGNYPPDGNLIKRGTLYSGQRVTWRGQFDEISNTVMGARLFDASSAGIDLIAPDDSARRIANSYGFQDVDSPGTYGHMPPIVEVGRPQIDPQDPYRFLIDGQQWYPAGYYPALDAVTIRWDGVALQTYYQELIDRLSANGLNYCRLVFSMGEALNWGSIPQTIPFVVVGTVNKGGYIFGQVDLDQFNQAHFDYWRDLIQYARSKGVVVQFCILDSWHVRNNEPPWWGIEHDFYASGMNVNGFAIATANDWHTTDIGSAIWQRHIAIIEEVVDQLGDLPNIVWEIANEPRKYYDNNNYGDIIDKEGAPITDWTVKLGNQLKSYELATRGYNHLCMPVDYHDHQKTPGQRPTWRIGYSDCHTPSGVHRDMLYIQQLTAGGDSRFPARPMITDNDAGGSALDANGRRQKAWACLTADTHIDYFHFEMDNYATLISTDVTDGMKYIGYLRKFIHDLSVNLQGMQPSDGLVTSGWCLARSGSEYIIYLISGGSTTVSNLPASYTATWFNPRAGTYQTAGTGPTFNAPDGNDWVLYITSGAPAVQAPYYGTPAAIPGTIQAEDYDLGGQGLAYNDNSPGNAGLQYRTDDVDIEVCTDTGGGYNVGWIGDDEWLEYTVDVASPGLYDLNVRVAGHPTFCTSIDFNVTMDGQDVTGPQTTTPTTDWQDFKTFTVNDVQLDTHQQVMRLDMDSSNWNLNWIQTVLVFQFVTSDFDRDTDVDQEDFGFLQACFSGLLPYQQGCQPADLDGNGRVNLDDFNIFASCFNGPNQPPACP